MIKKLALCVTDLLYSYDVRLWTASVQITLGKEYSVRFCLYYPQEVEIG